MVKLLFGLLPYHINKKNMETIKHKTVAELVTQNIETAHIFKKYGIDFCCGGGQSIAKACAKKKVDFATLEAELLRAGEPDEKDYNYNQWDLDILTNHIIEVHHTYVEENIPLLLQYTDKVARVHGHHRSEVREIRELFQKVALELGPHLKKEELILFPFIKKLARAKKYNQILPRPHFSTVENPIRMMEAEHEDSGELLRKIAMLSDDYTPPEEACNTFRAMYAKLEEFEQDLHLHIHLENNILFPKALQLEKEITH